MTTKEYFLFECKNERKANNRLLMDLRYEKNAISKEQHKTYHQYGRLIKKLEDMEERTLLRIDQINKEIAEVEKMKEKKISKIWSK